MKIALITIGSRGDVQPFVALGCGLQAAGHAVTVVTHRLFAALVKEHGLTFRSISGNPREIIESHAGRSWMAVGQRPFESTRRFAAIIRPLMVTVLRECRDACHDVDAILYSSFVISNSCIFSLSSSSLIRILSVIFVDLSKSIVVLIFADFSQRNALNTICI